MSTSGGVGLALWTGAQADCRDWTSSSAVLEGSQELSQRRGSSFPGESPAESPRSPSVRGPRGEETGALELGGRACCGGSSGAQAGRMEGTWTCEPPGRRGQGRGGEGGARSTYPAKSAEGQSSPLREEEKEKVTQGSVRARRSFIQQETQNSTELRQEIGFVRLSASLRVATAARSRPEGGLPIQAGRGGECYLPGTSVSQPVLVLRGFHVAKHLGGK